MSNGVKVIMLWRDTILQTHHFVNNIIFQKHHFFISKRPHCDDNAGLKYTLGIIVLYNVMPQLWRLRRWPQLLASHWSEPLDLGLWLVHADLLLWWQGTDWQVTVVTPSPRDETCIICTICCSHRRKEAQTESMASPSHCYIPSVFLLTIFTQFLFRAAK